MYYYNYLRDISTWDHPGWVLRDGLFGPNEPVDERAIFAWEPHTWQYGRSEGTWKTSQTGKLVKLENYSNWTHSGQTKMSYETYEILRKKGHAKIAP